MHTYYLVQLLWSKSQPALWRNNEGGKLKGEATSSFWLGIPWSTTWTCLGEYQPQEEGKSTHIKKFEVSCWLHPCRVNFYTHTVIFPCFHQQKYSTKFEEKKGKTSGVTVLTTCYKQSGILNKNPCYMPSRHKQLIPSVLLAGYIISCQRGSPAAAPTK